MAELNPPWALENLATHHSNTNRMFMAASTGRGEGVIGGPTYLAVTQRGAGANMSVDVAAGSAVIFGDENAQQGTYGVVSDATKNLVVSAADPTNPRIDIVVAKVQDATYSGATNSWSLAVVTGTAAGSPSDPATPNNSIALARIAVAAAASSIVTANITDLRPYAPVGIYPTNSARHPDVLYGPYSQGAAVGFRPASFAGVSIFDMNTWSFLQYTTATTGYQPPWNMPWGIVARATPWTSDSSTTSVADITGASATWTAVANRRYRHVLNTHYFSTVLSDVVRFDVNTTGNVVVGDELSLDCVVFNVGNAQHEELIVHEQGIAAGSVTRKWRVHRAVGTGTVHSFSDATRQGTYVVEDMGPSGNPA